MPQVPSEARFSLVVVLRSEISTLCRSSSSLAVPENVIGLPGVTVSVGAEVGGVIAAGRVIGHRRGDAGRADDPVAVGGPRSDWPAVSMAVA